MKKLLLTLITAALVNATVPAQERPEEYLGLPGDNLNLYAVMKLFQESETLEGFEKNLNDENSRINNLDLNGDNLVDYISVADYVDGDVHTIVLRTALSKNDIQDIAVFTVQKFRDGAVQIQLVGDEDLYGKDYIIEPYYDDNIAGTPNPGFRGRPSNEVNVTVVHTTPFEIAAWPLVRFIYMPGYMVWRSSWYWGYYPAYWHPWQPFFWHYYYGYHYHWYSDYYAHYRLWHVYRYPRYHDFYYSNVRVHAPLVEVNISKGNYKGTYSHPEQRRDGEALYTSTRGSQGNRRTVSTPVNSQNRRSDPAPATGRQGEISRRSDPQGSSKSGTVRSSEQSQGQNRRPESGSNARTEVKSQAPESQPAARSKSDSGDRQVSAPRTSAQSDVSRRSSPAVSSRSSSGSSSKGSSARSSQSSQRSSSSSSKSGSRTSSKESKSSKSSSSGKSDSKDNSRRR